MKKIVLVNPPSSPLPQPLFPLSVMAAGAILDAQGYQVEIINGSLDSAGFIKQAVEKCRGAICLGISAMTGYQIEAGLALSRSVREYFPDLPIIWGGWHGSILPRETVKDSLVDIVVCGQGERTIFEAVQALEAGNRDFSGISGLAYKREGGVTVTPGRPFENINQFPPMPYHLVDAEPILQWRVQNGLGRMLDYTSSQGCPHNCTFCAEPMVMGRRWSGLSADRIADEWSRLTEKYRLDAIGLLDSNCFVDRKRVEDLCARLVQFRRPITWHNANATIKALVDYTPDMWELLAASGCRSILVGAESGSQDMLELVDKKCTTDDIIKVAEFGSRYGIMISFSFMTGLPTQAGIAGLEKEFKATLRMIHDILRINRLHDIKLFLYTPYPGSPLYDVSLKKGLKVPSTLGEWSKFELGNATTPWVSARFKETVDRVRMYTIPYFQRETAGGYKPFSLLKRLLIRLSGFRLRHGFLGFPIESRILHWWWKRKGIL